MRAREYGGFWRQGIRGGGMLDLDDARAEAGQQERGERSGQREREVEHRHARERWTAGD